jgi:hypothetical protein
MVFWCSDIEGNRERKTEDRRGLLNDVILTRRHVSDYSMELCLRLQVMR